MAFGAIMNISDGGRTISLAPFTREESLEFISPGMQQLKVTKYLSRHTAPVQDDEYEWYDKVRKASDQIVWGIWIEKGGTRELIGNTTLLGVAYSHTNQATSGIQINKPEYWGQGIASLAHKARTWYAFEVMGLHRIKSAVIQGNIASLKALEKVGYTHVYTERNDVFVDGVLRHTDKLELLNPSELSWQLWWGDETPTEAAVSARVRTQEALKWARNTLDV